MKEAEKPYTGR